MPWNFDGFFGWTAWAQENWREIWYVESEMCEYGWFSDDDYESNFKI
jgi:hypothetical protein